MFKVSAYNWTGNQTATGTAPIVGRTVATDPRVIPYGTELMINNQIYIAEDTGSFEGNHIDLYMGHDVQGAKNHGVPEIEVFIRK